MSSKKYFDQNAQNWDLMRQDFFQESIREKAFNKAEIVATKTAADIGAGTGFISEGLIDNKLKVIAIDESKEMLKIVQEKLDVNFIECLVGESNNLPLIDNYVDYVFANMYLHHTPSPVNAISEMVRILKPGGKIVITDLNSHTNDFLRKEHHDRWLGFNADEIEQWFLESGLKSVEVELVNEKCCATSCNESKTAQIDVLMAFGVK